jgi:hypothetical protein
MTPASFSLAGIFVTENPTKKRQLGQIRARYLAMVDVHLGASLFLTSRHVKDGCG